jgi:hypothetical protein
MKLTDDEKVELGTRFINMGTFRVLPGMLGLCGRRCIHTSAEHHRFAGILIEIEAHTMGEPSTHISHATTKGDFIPDLTDPATRGLAAYLVHEVYKSMPKGLT